MSLKTKAFLAVLVMGTMSSAPLVAAPTLYQGYDDDSAVGGPNPNSDAAASNFLSAAAAFGPVLTQNFENIAPGFSSNYTFPGFSLILSEPNFGPGFSGVTNTQYGGNVYGYDIDSGTGTFLGTSEGTATFTFSSPTNSFGFYTTGTQTVFGPASTIAFDGSDAQSLTVTQNTDGGATYFGFTDVNPFTSITLDSSNNTDALGIDRISFNAPNLVAAVPETSTWMMLIAGVGLIGGIMRLHKKSEDAFTRSVRAPAIA
jgi:hypothetical protein